MLTVMLGFFALFALVGVPVVAALALASAAGLVLTTDLSLLVVVQRMAVQLDTFVLLAIPLFIFAGALMNAGGLTERLFRLASALVGHLVGGLAQINVVLSIMFGGLSGSSSADAAAESKMLWPIMVRAGYHGDFAAAVTACSAIVAPVIPPSIALIIYASITGASVGRLFIAGIIPGLMLGLAMALVVRQVSLKRGYGRDHPRTSLRETLRVLVDSSWGLMMPVIIIGGIRFGVFTPTEAAGIAAIYALFVGLFIYRQLKITALPRVLADTSRDTGVVLLIIAAAAPFAWILTQARVPQTITAEVMSITSDPLFFLMVVNIFLLVLGCLMEATALLVVIVPVLAPVAFAMGIDPTHFGIVVVVNLMIGTVTPPFGQIVFVTSAVTRVPAEPIFKQALPFIGALLAVLMILTYVPDSFMWLVRLIGP